MIHFTLQVDGVIEQYESYSYFGNDRLYQITYGSSQDTLCRYYYDENGNTTYIGVGKILDPGNINSSVKIKDKFYEYSPSNLPIYSSTPNFGYLVWDTDTYGYAGDPCNWEYYHYNLDGNLNSKEYYTQQYAPGTWDIIETPVDYTKYTYDNLGRLTDELYGNFTGSTPTKVWEKQYSFNKGNENKIKLTYTDYINSANNMVKTDTYNKANRLATRSEEQNGTVQHNYDFDYDKAGNMTSKREGNTILSSYTYDGLNRTSSVTKGGVETFFTYNAVDQRLVKSSGNTSITSVWKGGRIDADYNNINGTITKNEYLLGDQGEIINGVLYTNMINGQGDVTSVINYNNDAVTDYRYDAYGNKTGGGTPVTPYNYRSQYFDSETGLYYLNARYYDPEIGAFTQADTYWGSIGDPATLNLYSYCGYNPVMSSDPSGHRFMPASMTSDEYDSGMGIQDTGETGTTLSPELTKEWDDMNEAFESEANPSLIDSFILNTSDRDDKKLDSAYDFVNWATCGIWGGIYTSTKQLDEKRNDSFYDWVNWATNGTAGTVRGALITDEPFSAQHLVDSFWTATLIYPFLKGFCNNYVSATTKTAVKAEVGAIEITEGAGEATGQVHHILTNKTMKALDDHPTLKGKFNREDPMFKYKAADADAHKGYQQWHRDVDSTVVD